MENYCEDQLVIFLKNLADSVEKKTLCEEQLENISEFFMMYKFQEQAIKDNYVDENKSEYNTDEIKTLEDIKNFLEKFTNKEESWVISAVRCPSAKIYVNSKDEFAFF